MALDLLIENNEVAFKALFTHATIGIVIVDSKGLIALANPFLCQLLGYKEKELEGENISILIPKNLRKKHQSHINSYFTKPLNRPMGQGMELRASKKEGEELFVEISLCSYNLNNEALAVAFISDISNQKRESEKIELYKNDLEKLVKERTADLNNALEREKELGKLKSRFVSLASHEFRTPLSTILSSTSLINKYNQDIGSEDITRHTTRIKGSVINLTNILNDFLSLDKLEQGAVKVTPEEFHWGELVKEVCEELENYFKVGQIVEKLHTGNSIVTTDKKLAKNILLNLISNASKYSGENKPITIKTEVAKNKISIEITDRGIGIPIEEQENLFSLFYRASNVGAIQGTGLGLNIVSKYVSLLGGTISVNSIPDVGTTFNISISTFEY